MPATSIHGRKPVDVTGIRDQVWRDVGTTKFLLKSDGAVWCVRVWLRLGREVSEIYFRTSENQVQHHVDVELRHEPEI